MDEATRGTSSEQQELGNGQLKLIALILAIHRLKILRSKNPEPDRGKA